jgi:hypothetical protein
VVLCLSVWEFYGLYSLRVIVHRIVVSRLLVGLGWNQVLCTPELLLPLVVSSALSSARCSMRPLVLNGGWGFMPSTGFVTYLVFSVGGWMRACFSAAPLPGAFTGVAPKVFLGVTLGPHDICRFWEQFVGLLVLAIFGGGGVDWVGLLTLT